MSEFGFEPGMHSYADQAGWYEDGVREHNATEVGRVIARYIADTTNFQRGNALVRGEMAATDKAGTRSAGTWAKNGKYVALAGGAMVIGALKSFANYQRNLNIFQANTDASAKTMADASRVAKKLGADLRFPGVTASDVAESLVELSKAGLPAKKAIKSVDDVLLLGTAGQMDYADAAEIAANSMNAFHLKAKDMPRLVDDIAGAALKSSSNVQDIAEAFRYASTSAVKLGIPIDMVTTLTGLLSNLGLKGDMAGTSLRMFLTSLAKPRSNPAADAMREAGLLIGGKKGTRQGKNMFFDEKGNLKAMDKIAQLYKTHVIDKMTKQQRLAFDQTVFGTRGQNLSAIFNKGAKGIREFHKESTKAGSANKLAKANTKGLYGAYQGLVNVIQTLGLELGEELAPTATKILRIMSKWAGELQKNKGFVKGLAKTILAIVAGIIAWNAILIVWRATQIVSNAVMLIGKGLMIAYRTAVVAIRAPLALLTVIQEGFNAALLANPIGLIVLGIAAVILILRHYGVSMKDVIKWTKHVWAVTKDAFAKIKHVIEWCITWIKQHWAIAIMAMVAAPALVVILIIKKWHKIVNFLKNDFAPLMWKALKAAFAWLWKQIKIIGPQAYEFGKSIGKQIANGIKDAAIDGAKGLFDKWKDVATHPWKATGGYWMLKGGKMVWNQASDMGNKSPAKPMPHGHSAIHGGRRAQGGTVWGGRGYWVGEKGPEWFSPGAGGTISPAGGGGAPSVNIEHMSVRSEDDPYVVATMLSQKLRLAQ